MKKGRIIYTDNFLGALLVEIVEQHRNSVICNFSINEIINIYKEKRRKATTVVILSFELKDQEDSQMLVLEFNTKEVSAGTCLEIADELSKKCKNLEVKIKTAL